MLTGGLRRCQAVVSPSKTAHCTSFADGVIGFDVYATPGILLRPRLRGCAPEFIAGGKSQRQPCDGAEIEAAGGDVVLADRGLVAGEADGEPAVAIESAGGGDLAGHDGGESTTD